MPSLHALSVLAPDGLADAVAAALFEAGASGCEEKRHTDRVELVVYGAPAYLAAIRRAVSACFRPDELERIEWREASVADDWNERWMESLRPARLTETFTTVPSRTALSESPSEIVLRPGLAFGYGEHPTTRLAASLVEAHCRRRPGLSVLDVGTGTGVLSVVAARCGASAVLAIDIDEEAARTARENIRLNRVGVSVKVAAIEELSEAYDLIVANLDAPTLRRLAPSLASRCHPRGHVIVAGFLLADETELKHRFDAVGLAIENRLLEEDWPVWSLAANSRGSAPRG